MNRTEYEHRRDEWSTRTACLMLACVATAFLADYWSWFRIVGLMLFLLAAWCFWKYGQVPELTDEEDS